MSGLRFESNLVHSESSLTRYYVENSINLNVTKILLKLDDDIWCLSG